MLKITIFFLLITLNLFSLTLNDTYYVNSNKIKLLDVAPDAKYDLTIYKINTNKYSKRIKSEKLIKLLKSHGISPVESSSRYVKFIKKSPIDTSKIELKILKTYKSIYPDINISSLQVIPRSYIKSLPKKYEVIMSKKAHLSNRGTLSIKTPERQKIFFDYRIDARLNIYASTKNIKKGDKVSLINTTKKNIIFNKFKAIPITSNELNKVQAKYNTKQDSIITSKNTVLLNIIRKGSYVTANLRDETINISFSAKALQNGKLNDIITVQKRSGQKLRAKIIGKNRVEIR